MTFMSPNKFSIHDDLQPSPASRRRSVARRPLSAVNTNSPFKTAQADGKGPVKQAIRNLAREQAAPVDANNNGSTAFELPSDSLQHVPERQSSRIFTIGTVAVVIASVMYALNAPATPFAPAPISLAPSLPAGLAPSRLFGNQEGPSPAVADFRETPPCPDVLKRPRCVRLARCDTMCAAKYLSLRACSEPTSLFGDDEPAQPIEFAADDVDQRFPFVSAQAAEAFDPATHHPFVSAEEKEAFEEDMAKEVAEWEVWEDARDATDSEDEDEAPVEERPWDAALIAGPLHIPAGHRGNLHLPADFGGYARLTAGGELFLFESPAAANPDGMLLVDTCMTSLEEASSDLPDVCFEIPTPGRKVAGCVDEVEDAAAWHTAMRAVPCFAA